MLSKNSFVSTGFKIIVISLLILFVVLLFWGQTEPDVTTPVPPEPRFSETKEGEVNNEPITDPVSTITEPSETDSATQSPPALETETVPIVAPPVTIDSDVASSPVSDPEPVTTTQPSANFLWGAYTGHSMDSLYAFEELVGAQVDIKADFINWDYSFPAREHKPLVAENRTFLLFWEQYGVTLDDLVAGKHDEYIEEFAAEIAAYEGEVILAPLHEMNGNWDPWGGMVGDNTPAKVVAAWRHIHDVFGEIPNVSFAWTVNNLSVPNTAENHFSVYYPGDEYVDYVAVDGFNFGRPWQSFHEVFAAILPDLALYGKPVYILSMGSAEGEQKAAWIRDAFLNELPKYPFVVGWVWFNQNKEADWRVNSDPASLEAFSAVVQSY